MGKAQTRAQNKYISKRYDRINLLIEKDGNITKPIIQAHAAERGKSLNSFINEAIEEKIQRDNENN